MNRVFFNKINTQLLSSLSIPIKISLSVVAIWLLILLPHSMQAQIWDGNSDGDGDGTSWNDPLNWDNDLVPGIGDDVVINLPGSAILIPGSGSGTVSPIRSLDINAIVSNLRIVNGALLTIDGTGGATGFGLQIQGNGYDFQVDVGGLLQIQNIAGQGIVNLNRMDFTNHGIVSIENTSGQGILNEVTMDNVTLNFGGSGELLLDNVATNNGHGLQNRIEGNTTFNGTINFDQGLVDINRVGNNDGLRNIIAATVNQSTINFGTLTGVGSLAINDIARDGIGNDISALAINQNRINFGPNNGPITISNTSRVGIRNQSGNDGIINFETSNLLVLQDISTNAIVNIANNTSEVKFTNGDEVKIDTVGNDGIVNRGAGQAIFVNDGFSKITISNVTNSAIENLEGSLIINGNCALILVGSTPTGLIQSGLSSFVNHGLLSLFGTTGDDATSAGTFNNTNGRVIVAGGTPSGFTGAAPNPDAALNDSDGTLDGIASSLAETAPIHIIANGNTFADPIIACEGDPDLVLSIVNDSGTGTYLWSNEETTSTITLTTLPDSTGLYGIAISNATAGPGCETYSAFVNVIINPAPPALALGGNNTLTICSDEPAGAGRRVIADDSSPLIDVIQWTLVTSPTTGVLTDFFNIIGPNGRTAEALTTAPAGVYELEMTTVSADGCSSLSPATFTVTINELPLGSIAVNAAVICVDDAMIDLTFTATAGTGPFELLIGSDADGNNTFEAGDNMTITQNSGGNPLMSGDVFTIQRLGLEGGGSAGAYEIRLRSIEASTGCQTTGIGQDVMLTVNPEIIGADITPATAELCASNDDVQLAVSTIDIGAGAVAPPAGFTYLWTLDNPALGSFDNATLINPTFTAAAGLLTNTAAMATVTITDADGQCMAAFSRQIDIYISITPTAVAINTCTSDGMTYNLTVNNAAINSGGIGQVQWFENDPDNGGVRIDDLGTGANEEETFNLTSFINGGGTVWAAIVNGPCREAIPITVNFNDPQGTISVASPICASDGTVSLTFNSSLAGDFMINLATDENDGGVFDNASGNPYTVADGDQIVLTAGVDYDAAAVLGGATHTLSIQLQRIEDAAGCFVTGLTQTVDAVIDPNPIVLLRDNGTTVASGNTISICNGSIAGYSLRLTGANPDDLPVEFLVTNVMMTPPMSVDLSSAWQLNIAYPATAGPYPTETTVPTPTLAAGMVSGAVTYEVTPQTTTSNCQANPITFTIQLEETPDIFVVEGITADTLCDGTSPPLTLATNFFPNSDVEFTITVIDDDTGDGDDGVSGGVNQVIDGATAVYDPIANHSTFMIPDILTNADADGTAGDEYEAQVIHYQITVNRKNPPGPNCGTPNQIDLYFTILPDAFDLLTFTNNDLAICSGENSDISIGLTVEGNEFVGPVEGGPHKIQLSINPMNAPNANNPSMISVPSSTNFVFGNDPDGPDNIAGNSDDEVLTVNIADLLANMTGDHARVAYNFEATLVTPTGDVLCTHVFPINYVRVNPEPVLEQTTLTEICSGSPITVVDLMTENPVSAIGAMPALQAVTADWTITTLPTGVSATTSMGTEQITPALAGTMTTLTNSTNSPQTVVFEFTPQNARGCLGASFEANLIVQPLPAGDISFATGNESICLGETIQLDFSSLAGALPYDIIIAVDPVNPDDGNTTYDNLATITVTNPANGISIAPSDLPLALQSFTGELSIRLVSITDANACSQIINDDVSLTINEIPAFTAVGPRRRCQNDTRAIFIGVSGGSGIYSYAWTPAGAFVDPTIEDAVFDASVVPGTYPVSVKVTDTQSGCMETASFNVIIESLPEVSLVPSATTICEGEMVSLTFNETIDAGLPFTITATIDDGMGGMTTMMQTGLTDMGTLDFTEGTDFNGSATISDIEVNFENAPTNCMRSFPDITVTVIPDPTVDIVYNTPTAAAGTICSEDNVSVTLSTTASGVEGTDYAYMLTDIRYDLGNDGSIDGNNGYPTDVTGNLLVGQTLTTGAGLSDQLTNSTDSDVLIRYQVQAVLLNTQACVGPVRNIAVVVKPAAPVPDLTLELDGSAAPIDGSTVCLGTVAQGTLSNPSAAQMIFHLTINNPDEVFGVGVLPTGLFTEADGLIVPPMSGPFPVGPFIATNNGIITMTLTSYPDANSNGVLEADEAACPADVINLSLNVVADPDISITYNTNPTASRGEICSGSDLDIGLSSTSAGAEGSDYEFVIMNIRHDDGLSGDNDILTPPGAANGYGPLTGSGNFAIGDVVSGGITEALTNSLNTAVRISYQVKTRLINAPNCEGPARWINVVVKGTLSSSITAVGPVCIQDAAFNLVAMPAGGTFSGPGITNMTTGTFDPMDARIGTHTINYNFTDATGCTTTAMTMITVGPDINFPPAGPFCVDAAAVILPATPAGGTFSGAGVDMTTGEFTPATAGVGLHPISYEYTDASGCMGQVTIMITVGPLISPTIDAAGAFCVNAASVNLTAMPAGGTFSGTGITDAAAGTFDPATAGIGTHTISYSVMMNGCMATTTSMITVQDLPVITFGTLPSLCLDRPAVLLPVMPAGGTFSGTGIDLVTGEFDPGVAGLGTHTISYSVTDGNGCMNTATIDIRVPECLDPYIEDPSITDPCVCLTNGRFSEEVTVFSNPGESWAIVSTTLLNPLSGLPYLAGTALTEVPVNVDTSRYVITGIHLDGQGYTLSANSPQHLGVLLSTANTCYYPQLNFVGLNNAYCSNANPITIQASAGGVAGTGQISVNGTDLTTTENPATGIWSANLNAVPLPNGTYTVDFNFDAGTAGSMDPTDPGCIADIRERIQLLSTAGALACNDTINLSLDLLCRGDVNADMILEGTYMLDIFQVIIYDANNDTLNGPIDETYIGQYLTASVIDTCSGNSCWGVIFVEDKLPPRLTCGRDTVECDDDLSPEALGLPIPASATATSTGSNSYSVSGLDSCGLVNLTYTDTETPASCQGEFSYKIYRTWIAADNSGNSSTCTDTICVERSTLATTDLPENFDGLTNPAFLCSDTWPQTPEGHPSPDTTGRPGSTACFNIQSTFTDTRIDICEGMYKVIRKWTLVDWCTGGIRFHNQLLKVMDNVAPMLTCLADTTISTSPDLCVASAFLPLPTIVDLCSSSYTISATSTGGTISQTGNVITISNVPVGVYTITYTVADDCGNVATCDMRLTVEDQMPPSAVCDLHTTATLLPDGTVEVMAPTFDDGSHDNCGMVFFKARRMDINGCSGLNGDDNPATADYDEWFDDSVWFCCEDGLVPEIMVIFRVYDIDPGVGPVDESRHAQGGDLFGHYNDCMVRVEVQDNAPAALQCPPAITVSCSFTYDINNLGATFGNVVADPALRQAIIINDPGNTGVAQPVNWGLDGLVSGSCGGMVTESVISNLNTCGVGTITRTFTPAGSGASCSQVITIMDFDPFLESDITWAPDITLNDCANSNTDPSATGRPMYNDGPCRMVADTFTQEVFNFDTACLKIFRYWVVIDWCSFDQATGAGIFRDTQVIKLLDAVDPVISSSCADTMICVSPTSCEVDLTLSATATDDCTPVNLLDWTWSLDLDNDGNFDDTGTGNSISRIYQLGTHRIVWRVADGCNNFDTCTRIFTVEDCTDPTLLCTGGQIVIQLPPRSGNSIEINANIFNLSVSDNCAPDDSIRFAFSTNINDTIAVVTCLDVLNGPVTLNVYAFDESGNIAGPCMVTVDLRGCDVIQTATITGEIRNEEGVEMEEIMVRLAGGMAMDDMTNLDGAYYFNDLPTGYNYTITPEKDTDPLQGVTTYDLVLISKHILGVELLTSPYKIIAADANASGGVSTLDMVEIRKLILQLSTQFTDNTSWRFIDRDYSFPNPDNPFSHTFPEAYFVNGLDQDVSSHFVAIKTGDVNCSATSNLLDSEDRNVNGQLSLQVEEQLLKAGQEYRLGFTAAEFDALLGYQFSLNFDTDLLEFVAVESKELPNLSAQNFGLNLLDRGLITTSWHRPQAVTLEEDALLFELHFRAKGSGQLSDVIAIGTPATMQAEAYSQQKGLLDVALEFGSPSMTPRFVLHQNRPNPFRDETLIGFELPKAGAATLSIYDLSGKVLQVYEGEYLAGYNEISVNRSVLPHTGLLYYQLDTPGHTAVRKMTLLD